MDEEYVLLTDEGELESFEEARKDTHCHKWLSAMQDEMDSLHENHMYELTKLPKGKTLAVIVLDGWGEQIADQYNAIHVANTPTMDSLKKVLSLCIKHIHTNLTMLFFHSLSSMSFSCRVIMISVSYFLFFYVRIASLG